MKNFSTLTELLLFQAAKYHNPQALGFKREDKWEFFSNQEFLEKSFHFACALKEMGLKEKQTVAIFAYQNPLWLIADFGTILAGGISVPIFHDISKENLLFEIEDSNSQFIFSDDKNILQILKGKEVKIIANFIAAKKPGEPYFIYFDEAIKKGRRAAQEKKYNLQNLAQLAKEDDLATIIYTSGSTGKPKGVELTHANLVSQIKATKEFFPLNAKRDHALSFLPLAHIFERMVTMFYITQGVKISFIDNPKNLGKYLRELNPTLMTTVPRMLEKIFTRIKENVENSDSISRFIASKAVERAINKPVDVKPSFIEEILDSIYDNLVYNKFRAALGSRMRMIICGGSALSHEIEKFYYNIKVNLYCGYGMTESSPVIAANCPTQNKFGTVGKAFPQVELKIAQDGELLARGPGIMRGYHNQQQKTKQTIIDGWLHTGDQASIDDEGFVTLTGRKKELFKTANGKYVSPIPIEQKLTQELGFLIGAIIIAEGRKFTSALLFPDFENLEKIKIKLNFNSKNDEEFLRSKNLYDYVESTIASINADLDHAQQIQKFCIITHAISVASGEITPSMKLKRNLLEDKFSEEIDDLYKE